MMPTTSGVDPFTLLITDDDLSIREGLREILEPEGFRTVLATCGEEAIEVVRDQDIHLALMDFHLPRLSGLETLEVARTIRATLPAILITGEPDETTLRKALSAHVFCVVPKPVSRHLVIYQVQRALRRYYPGLPRP